MTFSKSNIIVNNEARQALIVTCDEPTEFGIVIKDEREGAVTTYYVTGVYRQFEKDGKYEYWFLPRIEETVYVDDTVARASVASLEEQLAQADEVAIELYETQMSQDEALIELYELIGG